jgi:hypothetical protein
VADVSADADPYTGVAIYNSYSGGGWQTIGGTSLSSPLIAATFALAGGAQGVDYPAKTLYQHLGGSGLHDVVEGSNAFDPSECVDVAICEAVPGYDGPTGVGTPEGLAAFSANSSWPAPTVTGVSPAGGPTGGGTTVTITGTNLGEAIEVRFGNLKGTIVDDEEGSITVEAPGHEAGLVDIRVISPHGISSAITAADHFTYAEPAEEPLTISVGGSGHGRVSATPGTPCETLCTESFAEGTTVLLTAAPGSGSTFSGWSGAGCSGTGSCAVTLWGSATVTATFASTGAVGPIPIVTVPLVEPQPGPSSQPAPAATEPPRESATDPFAGCVATAHHAFRQAKRAASHAHGKARVRALAKANRRLGKQIARCRSSYPTR